MANTFIEYTGNGSTTNYSFTFEYIKEAEVKVTLDGASTTAFTFANATTLSFNTAPASGVKIRIYRETDVSSLKATFFPGSAIKAEDLNDNFTQNNFAVEEIRESTWDVDTETIKSNETWVSNDSQIATTAAMDARFQDEASETFTKSELAANSNVMPNDDVALPTTGALNDYIDEVITNDIAGSDGVTITDDGDGTITVGLADNSVDFDKIKDADQIKLANQESSANDPGSDDKVFTSSAAARRFDNYVQNSAPSANGIGKGAVWVDPDDDLTLSVWNGSSWLAITSGGTFTNQPKVVYVDANSGSDSNDGHRISRPKKTIKAALNDINSDSSGDGSIVSVAPGIYAETLPLDIQKNDIGIIGQSLRTCIIHPKIPTSDHATYGVDNPHSQELQTMFRVNSGSYFTNLTLTGLKASGTRGASGSLYTDSTYGLPPNQGWNFAFYPNAVIKKSPYIQNVTNFSDSKINNVNFTPHIPGEGAAGDLDSAPTGGGILVDGSVPATSSPLRSMVCDSYTHTALDGPGIFVTNNGYCQATSSYAFFNHAHVTCLNGGQSNLAASTSDFGRFALIADGKSPSAIFTANVDGAASDNSITFNIHPPSAQSGWFGDATRPQDNMLVTLNNITYPVLSATSYTDSQGNTNGWTVTISRPDPTDATNNLGLDGAVSDNAVASFFLRSMIASSGHTMEYVGSGTDYRALPENGGVPVDSNQLKELNQGKVWSAITDHKGTFKLGDFFTINQQEGSLVINDGSFKVNLEELRLDTSGNAIFGAPLDMGTHKVFSSSGNLKLDATGDIDAQTNKIINVVNPTNAQDAVTKSYVDTNTINEVVEDLSPQLGANLDTNNFKIVGPSNSNIVLDPVGTGRVQIENGLCINNDDTNNAQLHVSTHSNAPSTYYSIIQLTTANTGDADTDGFLVYTNELECGLWNKENTYMQFATNNTEKMRITADGNVGIGVTNPNHPLVIQDDQQYKGLLLRNSSTTNLILGGYTSENKSGFIQFYKEDGTVGALIKAQNNSFLSSGNFGLGHNAPSVLFHVKATYNNPILFETTSDKSQIRFKNSTTDNVYIGSFAGDFRILTNTTERVRVKNSGDIGIGTSAPVAKLEVSTDTLGEGLRISRGTGTSANQYIDLSTSSGGNRITSSFNNAAKKNLTFFVRNHDLGTNEAVMHITPDKRVGIGEDNPQGILEIGGNSQSQEIRLGDGTTIGYWLTGIRANRPNSNTAIHIHDFRWGDTAVARIKSLTGSDNTNKNNGLLTFETASGTNTIQERMRITEDGNVGIGTTAPAVDLEVNGQCIFDSTGTSGRTIKIVKNNQPQASWYVGTTEQLRIQCTSAGNFIDNLSSKNLKFRYGSTGTATAVELDGSDGSVTFSEEVTCSENVTCTKNISAQSNQIRLITTGTGDNARGIVQIVPPSSVSNTSNVFYVTPAGGSGSTIQFTKSGNATFAGTINGTTVGTSDQRFKENIAPAGSQLEDVTALGKILKNFNWNDEAPVSTEVRATRQLGLIAQEVETISPSLIKTINTNSINEEGEEINDSYKGISHDALVMKLLGAIAELSEKVAALEAAN